jgi:predicted metalloprotease with PDZ domain
VPAALEAGAVARRGAHFDRLAGSIGNALFESGAVTLDGPGARLIVELPGLPEPAPLPGGFGFALTRRQGTALAIGAVIDGGPAAAASVGPGDAVLAIDGSDVRTASPAQAWQMLARRDAATFELATRDAPARRVRLDRQRFFPLLR